MHRLFYYLLLILFSTECLNAQDRLALGSWRSHLAGRSGSTLAKVGNSIFCGSQYSLFSYDTESGVIKSLSKVEGFSRSDISKIGHSEATGTTVIGYLNGQIDLIKGSQIIPANDIFNAKVSGSKKINHLYFVNDKVWISTDFGLVVYNISKTEVTETYSNFSSSNVQLQLFSSTLYDDSVFIATSSGLFVASASPSINKLDYRSWRKMPTPPSARPNQIAYLSTYADGVFVSGAAYMNKYKRGVYGVNFQLPTNSINNTCISNGKLWFLLDGYVCAYDGSNLVTEFWPGEVSRSMEVAQSTDGTIWVADIGLGMIEKKNGVRRPLVPNGPLENTVFRLSKYQDKIVALNGGFDINLASLGRQGAFSVFDKGMWKNYSRSNNNFRQCEDIVSYSYNPSNNKSYLAAFGWGVVEWDLDTSYTLWNNKNSPLNVCNIGDFCYTDYPNPQGGNYCKVEKAALDNAGKLWAINHQDTYDNTTPGVLFSYDLKGSWTPINWRGTDKWGSTNYSDVSNDKVHYLTDMFVDKNNTKWMVSRNGGLLAYNENFSNLPRYLSYVKGSKEEICGLIPLSMIDDLNGAMWIGTDNGVCYFSDAKEVFQMKTLKAAVPVYQNRALLAGNKITALEVDGGNRKWIGTETSGAWLFSGDGTTLIAHFDQTNSPLPSDLIVDIKINDKTGEVFIATDRGIFSYLSDAVLGEDQNSEVFAYPNPITSSFTGLLAISGIVSDATVKITDISGQLVYQTKAQGSLATWNIRDYNGRRVQPGVYLVFTSKEDGSEALATKIAVID